MNEYLYNMVVYPYFFTLDAVFSLVNTWTGSPYVALLFDALLLKVFFSIVQPYTQDVKQIEIKRWVIKETVLKNLIFFCGQIAAFIAVYDYINQNDVLQQVLFRQIFGQSKVYIFFTEFYFNLYAIILAVLILVCEFAKKNRKTKRACIIALLFLCVLYQASDWIIYFWIIYFSFYLLEVIFCRFTKKWNNKYEKKNSMPNAILGNLFLTIMIGGVVPSALVSASPLEFIDARYNQPIDNVFQTLLITMGIFVLWGSLYYSIVSPVKKYIYEIIVWTLTVVTILNYLFFGTKLGIINTSLVFEEIPTYSVGAKMLNSFLVFILGTLAVVIYKKSNFFVQFLYTILIISALGICIPNIYEIQKKVVDNKYVYDMYTQKEYGILHLSRKGKNVVVIMMDRAIGELYPYITSENPQILKQFEGFTYYSNMLSYGVRTNVGIMPLMGGYEYTPERINSRPEKTMKEEYNECSLLMPMVFLNNGFNVVLCDVPYAGYHEVGDMSFFNINNEISTYYTDGNYTDTSSLNDNAYVDQIIKHKYLMYSIFKVSPVIFQSTLYDSGRYLNSLTQLYSYIGFMDSYSVLQELNNLTSIDVDGDNFIFLANQSTHRPTTLQQPEYTVVNSPDNTAYYKEWEKKLRAYGDINMETQSQMQHYMVNMASYVAIGKWLDFLRENDLYDNTRIIIVSDHGYGTRYFDNQILSDGLDIGKFNSILLVKDFDSIESSMVNDFMTTADVPTLAVKGVIDYPCNPFTGLPISDEDKVKEQLVTTRDREMKYTTDEYIFDNIGDEAWYKVRNNIFDVNNWIPVE